MPLARNTHPPNRDNSTPHQPTRTDPETAKRNYRKSTAEGVYLRPYKYLDMRASPSLTKPKVPGLDLSNRIVQLESHLQSIRSHRENKIISSAKVVKNRARKSIGHIPTELLLGLSSSAVENDDSSFDSERAASSQAHIGDAGLFAPSSGMGQRLEGVEIELEAMSVPCVEGAMKEDAPCSISLTHAVGAGDNDDGGVNSGLLVVDRSLGIDANKLSVAPELPETGNNLNRVVQRRGTL